MSAKHIRCDHCRDYIHHDITVEVRAKAWAHLPIQTVRCLVSDDGVVSVYDDTAGYYTRCHSLSAGAMRRIKALALATQRACAEVRS